MLQGSENCGISFILDPTGGVAYPYSMKKQMILIVAVAAAALFLTGCATDALQEQNREPRTISVSGTGEVSGTPDWAQFSVGYSHLDESTREAQRAVNQRMNHIAVLLQGHGIPDDQVTLQQLSVSPEYIWRDGERYLAGQRVTQRLSVEISILDGTGGLALILDELGEIQGVEISSINFSIKDPSDLHVHARELAYTHAQQKARQLAELSSMELYKPVSMSESSSDTMFMQEPMMRTMAGAETMKDTTIVPPGELNITSRVSVVFEIR